MPFVNAMFEVIILDDTFYGFPVALGFLFNSDHDLRDYFFSLPEETQQALIQEDIHSSDDLHDCIERYKLKE